MELENNHISMAFKSNHKTTLFYFVYECYTFHKLALSSKKHGVLKENSNLTVILSSVKDYFLMKL